MRGTCPEQLLCFTRLRILLCGAPIVKHHKQLRLQDVGQVAPKWRVVAHAGKEGVQWHVGLRLSGGTRLAELIHLAVVDLARVHSAGAIATTALGEFR